jgi:hypothetical protein
MVEVGVEEFIKPLFLAVPAEVAVLPVEIPEHREELMEVLKAILEVVVEPTVVRMMLVVEEAEQDLLELLWEVGE